MDQIGLYQIKYEFASEQDKREPNLWVAGIVAYNNEDAVKTLGASVKRDFKINELSFQGRCDEISKGLRFKIAEALSVDELKKIIAQKEQQNKPVEKKKPIKKSIIKEEPKTEAK